MPKARGKGLAARRKFWWPTSRWGHSFAENAPKLTSLDAGRHPLSMCMRGCRELNHGAPSSIKKGGIPTSPNFFYFFFFSFFLFFSLFSFLPFLIFFCLHPVCSVMLCLISRSGWKQRASALPASLLAIFSRSRASIVACTP